MILDASGTISIAPSNSRSFALGADAAGDAVQELAHGGGLGLVALASGGDEDVQDEQLESLLRYQA